MYGNIGSISGMVHLVARRPVLAATVALAVVSVAYFPTTPPPPPTPPPPAVVTFTAPAPVVADSENITTDPGGQAENYSCEFAKNTAPTNLCKATLDSIALFLNNDDKATVELTGSMDHVLAVRKYFVEGESKFGIASGRIHLHIESDGDNTVAIEQIP
jgi:hypothetical protein